MLKDHIEPYEFEKDQDTGNQNSFLELPWLYQQLKKPKKRTKLLNQVDVTYFIIQS